MTIPFFDLKAQYDELRGEISARLDEVLASQRFIMGPAVAEFEEAMRSFVGSPHVVSCASGTDAILLVLKAMNLSPDDEVITTPFTFFATGGAISNAGGRPVFVDIEEETLNIDPEAVAAAITPRTRAILPVHIFGQMARMEPLLRLGEDHNVPVIEDAAQAIGAYQGYAGSRHAAGTCGWAGTFSFFPTKNLGAWGDAGMITTSDPALADRLRLLRVHGGAKQYHHDEVGTNSRLDTVQAAVLLAKLPHLKEWTRKRQANAAAYTEALSSLPGVCPLRIDEGNEPVFNQYTLRVDRRDDLMAHLKKEGIGAAIYYPRALHVQPCFANLGYQEGALPVAERATADVLSLPVFPELTREQRERIIDAVRGFYA